ncbi:unnamed protein product [Ectocarpus sp. 4 AP-2014]
MSTSHGIFRIFAAGRRALSTMLQQQASTCFVPSILARVCTFAICVSHQPRSHKRNAKHLG